MKRPYPVITVKDSREGFVEAITKMAEVMKTGGGVGFDLRQITPSKQRTIQSEIEKESNNLQIQGIRSTSPKIERE